MSVCVLCGLTEEEHHAFEPRVMPAGCVCDPGTWESNVTEVCDGYEGDADGFAYCARCEHEAACHGGKR